MRTLARSVSLISLVLLTLSLAITVQAHAEDDGTTVKWKRIIGLTHPTTFVGDIPSGGFAFAVTSGRARVDLEDEEMKFKMRGLTLAGGPQGPPIVPPLAFVVIGTTRGITKVQGTLVCNVTSGPPFPKAVTPDVPLSAQGDAEFSGPVSIPVECTDLNDMAFLIRVAEVLPGIPPFLVGAWIAHGGVRKIGLDADED